MLSDNSFSLLRLLKRFCCIAVNTVIIAIIGINSKLKYSTTDFNGSSGKVGEEIF